MGFWQEITTEYRRQKAIDKTSGKQRVYNIRATGPRPVTEDEVDSWQRAAATRRTTKRITPEAMWKILQWENPVRARRLRKDFKWAQSRMEKNQLNPEDLRFIL